MIEIKQVDSEGLNRYQTVSIGFKVKSTLRVEPLELGLAGIQLKEEPEPTPYYRDYDIDEHPVDWSAQFDLRNWSFFLAEEGEQQPLGAAALAWNTPGVHMLEGRTDLAVLWDIRVRADARGRGVGALLFQAAEDQARTRGCTQLKVETQNINVPACRFYARMGCVLGGIHRFAYPKPYKHETMLLWYKDL
jgi:GNAT superfamily N-acetyltransferase